MSDDRYTIKEKIGQGGLGAVYKAFDNNLSRDVALKRVLPAKDEDPKEMADNLLKEAKTLSSLQHPHIVTVYDVGKDSEGPFVIMEFLKGETLDTTIGRGALPEDDFKEVVVQSLEALVAAQALGITHRDLKPANIMVIWLPSGKFQIKILDFGLAKFSHQPSVQTMDNSESIMGSIYFMAPEQFERKPLDARTDLYSLGSIYYFILTGKYPFQGDSAPQVMAAHMQHRFTPLAKLRPDLPPYLSGWVEWLMSKSVEDRPADASEALKFFREKKFGGKAATPVASPTGGTSAKLVPSGGTGTRSGKLVAGAGTRSGKLVASGAATPPAAAIPAAAAPVAAAAVAAPVPEAAAVIPEEEPASVILEEESGPVYKSPGFFGSIPKWAYITVPSLLIGIGLWYFIAKSGRDNTNEAAREYEELVNRVDDAKFDSKLAAATPKDVDVLASFLDDPIDNRDVSAANTMIYLQGPEIDDALIKELSRHKGQPLSYLIDAIGERGNTDAFEAVFKYSDSKNEKVRESVFSALGNIGSKSNVPQIVELFGVVETSSERGKLKNSLINILSKESDLSGRVSPLVSALNSADKESQKSILSILGTLGGPQARSTIEDFLQKADKDIRRAAVNALELWPNSTPLPKLVDFIKYEDDRSAKDSAISATVGLSLKPGPFPESKVLNYLKEAGEATEDKGTKREIYSAIAMLANDSAVGFFNDLKSDSAMADFCSKAIENVNMLKEKVVDLGVGGDLLPESAVMEPVGAFVRNGVLTQWMSPGNMIGWTFSVSEPGIFTIEIDQANSSANPGSYQVLVGDQIVTKKVVNTDGELKSFNIGRVQLESPGVYKLQIIPITVDSDDILMDFGAIRLTK